MNTYRVKLEVMAEVEAFDEGDALDYIKKRKEASKEKTQRMRNK